MAKYTDWYIDPSYSNTPTLWRDGFAMCLVDNADGKWSIEAYDEHNGAFNTGQPMFCMDDFADAAAAMSAAESRIVELSR